LAAGELLTTERLKMVAQAAEVILLHQVQVILVEQIRVLAAEEQLPAAAAAMAVMEPQEF
jgi:hypothetical protein